MERDPTAVEVVGVLGILRFFFYVLFFILLLGKFFTGDFLWNYRAQWASFKYFVCLISSQRRERCSQGVCNRVFPNAPDTRHTRTQRK